MVSIVILVVLFAAMWFFMLRPQQRRAAAQRALRSQAAVGSQVVLTSGIHGTVTERTDDYVLVDIADGVTIKVLPAAIGQVLPEPEPGADDAGGSNDSGADPTDGLGES